jgi:quercetin dioxygenase-like cupin family protein
MARIQLEEGEVFQHTHSSASETTLEAGEATLTFAGKTQRLMIGDTVAVPADTSHVVRNVGRGTATVQCGKHVGE